MQNPCPPRPQEGEPSPHVHEMLWSYWNFAHTLKQQVGPELRKSFDLDLREFLMLTLLQQHSVTPKALAHTLSIPPSQISRTIDDLCQKGFTTRQIDQQDARRLQIQLTEQGTTTLHQAGEVIRNHLHKLFEDFSEEELQTLNRLMQKLTQATPTGDQP